MGSLNTLPASEPSLRQIPRLMGIYFSLTHVNARNDLWCRILLSRTSGNFNVCKIVRQRYLPGLLVFFTHCHFLNHWLPFRYRFISKICAITYQALSFKQPAYLHSLLTPARQPRQRRSFNSNLLFFPVLRHISELELFSCCADYVELNVNSVGNIATFRRKLTI